MSELNRDTVVQACMVMLQAAKAQNESLRSECARVMDLNYNSFKTIEEMSVKLDNQALMLQSMKQEWVLLSATVCELSVRAGIIERNPDIQCILEFASRAVAPPPAPPPRPAGPSPLQWEHDSAHQFDLNDSN